MNLIEAREEFIHSRQKKDLSPISLKSYRDCLESFLQYLGYEFDINNLTPLFIERYIDMVMERGISRATKATYMRNLKIFLCWIEQTYNLQVYATSIFVPKTPKKILRIYTDCEIVEIFNSSVNYISWISDRNKAIIALMLDSGLRQNEVCTLEKKNLLFKQGIVKVLGKGSKERIVPLGNLAMQYVQRYLNNCPHKKSEYVFLNLYGIELTCDAVKHLMYKIASKLPFEFSSHKLRHNFATNYCLDQYEKYGQVDIYRLMVLMGHEDITTTRRYLHMANQIIATRTNISHIDRLMECLNPLDSKKKTLEESSIYQA